MNNSTVFDFNRKGKPMAKVDALQLITKTLIVGGVCGKKRGVLRSKTPLFFCMPLSAFLEL
jgi:hypothetical protein